MEVSTEAKRIMVVALGKLYSSRSQRGGLRLHRSLLLTLVMKSARDIYHAAHAAQESATSECVQPPSTVAMTAEPAGDQEELQTPGEPRTSSPEETRTGADNKLYLCPANPAQNSRKRRGKAAAEPDFLPCKKAKLESGNFPQQLALVDYVSCGSELVATPIPLQRAIAAC
ncbi:immediate early response gene 2 protein [Aulostomus maculatus]